jgi:excisionase family DNA binding protein
MPGHPGDPLTVAETAKLMGRSTEQIRRYLREGVLPGRRLGGQWFVDRSDVDALLHQRRVENDQWHWLTSGDRDPLRSVIALGGSGGGDIAAGVTQYLRSLARDEST